MAKRAPSDLPLLPDQLSVYVDPVVAAPIHPKIADQKQHALATEGRHTGGMTVGLFIDDGDTASIAVHVPPSVVYMRVRFLMVGDGYVSIDSTNNGVAKTWDNVTLADAASTAFLYQTSNIPGDLASSPLKVRSSAAWTWVTETVTVTFTSSTHTSNSGTIHGMTFEPVWLPADI